jgi:hypothetical protein
MTLTRDGSFFSLHRHRSLQFRSFCRSEKDGPFAGLLADPPLGLWHSLRSFINPDHAPGCFKSFRRCISSQCLVIAHTQAFTCSLSPGMPYEMTSIPFSQGLSGAHGKQQFPVSPRAGAQCRRRVPSRTHVRLESVPTKQSWLHSAGE